jgi:hypothetical protein
MTDGLAVGALGFQIEGAMDFAAGLGGVDVVVFGGCEVSTFADGTTLDGRIAAGRVLGTGAAPGSVPTEIGVRHLRQGTVPPRA